MTPLPVQDLRSNLGTWAVPLRLVPAVTRVLLEALPVEQYDPDFHGQDLETTYFDTNDFVLRKARRRGDQYLTLRIRCYQPDDVYALSGKTEDSKFRLEIDRWKAEAILGGATDLLFDLLPAAALGRLQELTGGEQLVKAAVVTARRYSVEDDRDRLTLDLDVSCDWGKRLPCAVLEFKSTAKTALCPPGLTALQLPPLKLSKFLWATEV
jgi:hypothetical protein